MNQKTSRRIWFVLVITLAIGTAWVMLKRMHVKPAGIEVREFSDSIALRKLSSKFSLPVLSFFELYEQKQIVLGLQRKDSLTQKDIATLQEIDRKLNDLMDEEN